MKKICLLGAGLLAQLFTSGQLFAQRGRGTGEFVAPRIKPRVTEEKKAAEERTGGFHTSGSRTVAEPKFSANTSTAEFISNNIRRQAAAKPVSPAVPAGNERLPAGSLKRSSTGTASLYKYKSPQMTSAAAQHPEGFYLYLPENGTAAAKWKKNYSGLREAMQMAKPIKDTYHQPDGSLQKIDLKTGGRYLNAERQTLLARGWSYDSKTTSWIPPVRR